MRATDRCSWQALGAAAVLLGACLGANQAWAQAQLPVAPQLAVPATPPAKVTVADVVVIGSQFIPKQAVMSTVKTKPGGEYRPDVVQEDVRILVASRQYRNVEARTRTEPDGKVTVFFYIWDFRTIVEDVKYLGAKHIKDDELERITGIRKGNPLNPNANKYACDAIVRKLNEDGRPFAACVLEKGDKQLDTEVIFRITEGPKVGLCAVQFSGNSWGESGRLVTLIQSKPTLGLFPGKYIPQMVEADIGKIEEYYKSFGFLDAHVVREIQLTPDGQDVVLILHVHEGVRYTFKAAPKLHVKNPPPDKPSSVPMEQLDQLTGIKAGAYYSQPVVDADVSKLKDYYGYTGRNAKVEANSVFEPSQPGVVTVNYEIEEASQARVGQIFIVGNERTRQNVILRQLPLFPGQLLTYPDLRQGERNLQRLGIFENGQGQNGQPGDPNAKPTVSVIDPDNPSQYKDILVSVQEANTGSLVFGAGVNSNTGLNGSIVLNERNFDIFKPPTSFDDLLSGNAWRGAGQEFRIEAMPGTEVQRYQISFREPFLFDTPNSLGAQGYYYTRIYNEYDEDRVGGRFTLGRKITPEWTLSGSVRIEEIEVNNVVDFAPTQILEYVGNHFLVGPRISGTYDTRDSFLRPTDGVLLDLSYEQDFGDYTFPVLSAGYNEYWTLFQRPDGSGRQVVSLKSQVSWAGADTPVYERFYAGGFQSIRGFEFRGVGPDIDGFKIGGDFMLLNSIEYQVPVMANDNVFVVAFVDSGTVESKLEITDYRVSAGFGLRLVVPMLGPVPIALDFGFPLVKGAADNTQVFSFFMGFSH